MRLFSLLQTSFNQFDESVHSYLSKTFDTLGQQYTNNQIFGLIFNGVKSVCQNIMFYIEDALSEQNIFTASRKKSIYSLAALSGFEPYYGSAATGTLIAKLQLNSGLSNDEDITKLYINNHTIIRNISTNISYTLDLPVNVYVIDVTKPLINHEFKIIQGAFQTAQRAAYGFSLESFNLSSNSLIDRNYIDVYVDGEKWEEVGNLYEMSEFAHQYFIKMGYNSTLEIIFGDDIHGQKLYEGQDIRVEYLVHSGSVGNISTNDVPQFIFYSAGYDGSGETVDINNFLTLTLNNFVSGGTNEDSIKRVRTMIGYQSRSNVLANESNFKLFFNRFSFIGYSNIWSERNSMTITANLVRDVKSDIESYQDYFNLDETDFILTDDQKAIITNVIDNSKRIYAGVNVNFIDPVIRKYAIMCYIKIDNTAAKESVIETIKNNIGKYFLSLETNTTFIAKSDIVTLIVNSDDSIISVDIDFISCLAEETFKNGYYNKYTIEYINGTNVYKTNKIIYETDSTPGLDVFGNIQLDTKLEIPIISGFRYYPDKDTKSYSMMIDPVTIIFM